MPSPHPADAALLLKDGSLFHGRALGRKGHAVGEVVFNTAMTGYQEVLTDPSYAGQIVAFTFPHIGNVGTNDEDPEAATPVARGLVVRADPTLPSNFRALQALDAWLDAHGLVGIAGIDTRRLTRHLRDQGAQTAGIVAASDLTPSNLQAAIEVLRAEVLAAPDMEGLDLAAGVTCRQRYAWDEGLWRLGEGFAAGSGDGAHVVAIDYGAKRNILRHLAERGFRVTVVPASTSSAEIMALAPDGIFLSNGPGDPAATGVYAVPVIQDLLQTGKPLFGICLGHQLLGLALGGRTVKMPFGHHGANHPVKDLATGKVEITSQNHGFAVEAESLPKGVAVSHLSLFDGTVEGLVVEGRPAFSVQYHPEAAPGPQDSAYLFDRFDALLRPQASKTR
ncbi:MAG: carbamoyl-phosphate synthase small subunit [Geminicoccaceae bacterium]|nr:MAG: carbamoyl-phosphate synthase small subunit [Geminicoccaceae bacterium]